MHTSTLTPQSLEPGAPLGHFTPSRVEFVWCQTAQTAIACPQPSTPIRCQTLPLPNQDLGMPLISCPAPETNFCDASMLRGPGGLCRWLRPCNFLQCRGHLAKTFGIFSARDEVEFMAQSPHRHHGRQRHHSLEDIADVKVIASIRHTKLH